MPTAQALESLKVLANGPGYRRMRPTEDYGFSGAVPTQGELESPFEMGQTAQADAADARDRAAVERVQRTNEFVNQHNRPDVKAIQDEEEQDALKRLLLPIQMKGQFDVEAAKQAQTAQTQRDDRLFGNRVELRGNQDAALMARAEANNKAVSLRQRLQSLQTGKAHAAPPSGLSSWVPGAQGRADQAEIQQLLQQLAAPEPNDPSEAPVGAGTLPAAGNGAETAAQQLARLRAGRLR